jgi:predicted PurR-regulated permease PerM
MSGSEAIGQALTTVHGIMVTVVVLPVLTFMMLFYQPLVLEFIRRLFSRANKSKVDEILVETKAIVENYLGGLIIEFAIVATLNSVSLLILGIESAVLLGLIGALLNMIPFIGGIIATSLAMMTALVTKGSPSYALLVLAILCCHSIR